MTEYAYVGISPCGCIRATVVDNPGRAKWVRKEVASFMRAGDTIERMAVELVRVRFCTDIHPRKGGCPHPGDCPYRPREASIRL